MKQHLLRIYLNDHLAGSLVGLEVARRAERENRDNAVGEYLRTLVPELREERERLREVMGAVGAARDPLKLVLAWVGEKAGRLKLNGRLARYSELSRLEELEGLLLGVNGKLAMWRLLERLQRDEPRLSRFDLHGLAEQAERQRRELERMRLLAAEAAFGAVLLETPGRGAPQAPPPH